MKTAFKIVPAEFPSTARQLLIEIGWEGLSLVQFSVTPFAVNSISVFHFEKNITAIDLAEELFNFFEAEQLHAFEKVHVCYNFKECTAVPLPLFKENMQTEILNLIYPINNRATNFAEPLEGLGVMLAYRVDNRVESVINQQFPLAQSSHALALQLPVLKQDPGLFYCIVYQHSIKVILFKNAQLQFIQFFDYATPTDVAYHLLNVCTQHDISPAEVTLTICGLIDRKSNLYDEVYRYFVTIKLAEFDSAVETDQAITQYPKHFFSHLISLAQCVS